MQGIKTFEPKLFPAFNLVDAIPKDNFYRRLKSVLDLRFLYKSTEKYYGSSGRKSIDPVVFFKLCLVGYLENTPSDRRLMDLCQVRLDIRYFIDHDIDEPLPWHSTISRTRQLLPSPLFDQVFDQVLGMCVDQGMVAGTTQAIDAAYVKANASMDSLELKVPETSLQVFSEKVRSINTLDNPSAEPITATKKELQEVKKRQENWTEHQPHRLPSKHKEASFTSNKTHYSPTDKDARISVKPGKPRALNYLAQLGVDTAQHVITHVHADYADKKDSLCLPAIMDRLQPRLASLNVPMENVLADAGYSSGENYALLEQRGLTAFIPPHGTYKGCPDGFTYIADQDYYLCPQGERARGQRVFMQDNSLRKTYATKRTDCKNCPIKSQCIGKSFEKRFTVTFYRSHYERVIQRLKTPEGRRMKGKRQGTVEPVLGTLLNFMGIRKVFTIGIAQAHKQMVLSAVAYNLKKYLKYQFRPTSRVHEDKKSLALFILAFISPSAIGKMTFT